MKKLVTGLLSLALMVPAATLAGAAEYPIRKPHNLDWSFGGPFGTYDKGQLQRGLKVYIEACAACHGLERVAFRTLDDLGYNDDQIGALASNYQVEDGPNDEGEMFMRPAVATDHFPPPFPNKEAAAYANNGAAPPDLSLIAKARAAERGFPTFVFDIFTMYQESGPDYVYSLLTGYEDPPEDKEIPQGTYYNPYFLSGVSLAMPQPLFDDMVTYDDGAPQTTEQYARDVAAFLMWTAEPHLEERKSTGFVVLIYLAIFAVLLFLTKRALFSRLEH